MAYPLEFHAGIGVGDWTTVVANGDTGYQDGSAYHYARKAVEAAKRETDYSALLFSGDRRDANWNALMNAGFQLTDGNTTKQNELALYLEFFFPIWSSEMMRLDCLYELLELIFRRPSPLISKKGGQLYAYSLNSPELFSRFLYESKVLNRDPLFPIYSYAHPYGAASELAEALGLTRQAVDASLRASKVYAERAVALALLEYAD